MKALTPKIKNKLLAILALLLVYLSYSLAINETIKVYSHAEQMQKELIGATAAPEKSKILEKSLQKMSEVSGNNSDTMYNVQQKLLDYVTRYSLSNDIFLREVPHTIKSNQKDIEIETFVFTAEAGFIPLLKMLHDLETNQRIGKISSVSFQTKQDYKTKAISLSSTIYLQFVRKINR